MIAVNFYFNSPAQGHSNPELDPRFLVNVISAGRGVYPIEMNGFIVLVEGDAPGVFVQRGILPTFPSSYKINRFQYLPSKTSW